MQLLLILNEQTSSPGLLLFWELGELGGTWGVFKYFQMTSVRVANHPNFTSSRFIRQKSSRERPRPSSISDLQYSVESSPTSSGTGKYSSLHYTTLHYTTLHYTTVPYTTLHYTTLHYTTLHYNTLHYTILHYSTVYSVHLYSTVLSPPPPPQCPPSRQCRRQIPPPLPGLSHRWAL